MPINEFIALIMSAGEGLRRSESIVQILDIVARALGLW
jgi:hypothetical protein